MKKGMGIMKKITTMVLAAVLCLSMVWMTGCGGNANGDAGKDSGTDAGTNAGAETGQSGEQAAETEFPLTIKDDLGNEVVLEKAPERVVSLSPSATEILFAVGAGEQVVGRTDYCSYPEEASKVDSIGTYIDPNTELILSKEPDVVLASDYIDDAIKSQIEAVGAKVILLSANSLEAIEADILLVGKVLNQNEKAGEVVEDMNAELKEVQEITAKAEEKKSVFVDIGSFYSAGPGSLLDDELNKLGAVNIAAEAGETWPQISVETIIEKNPDVYISLFTSVDELKTISGLNELDCMKNDQVVFYDGLSKEADMIQRSGPRVTKGIRLLAESIYPELFK